MAKRARKQTIERYVAHKSVKANAKAKAIQSAYKIEVRFMGGLTTAQKSGIQEGGRPLDEGHRRRPAERHGGR